MEINKNLVYLNGPIQNFKFNLKRGHGHLGSYILDRLRWHLNPRLKHVSRFPTHVDIETSSACNLRCPMCYTVTDEFKEKVSLMHMDFELFKKLVDECASYSSNYSIRLSWRGEPFLNPKIFDMVRYAKKAGIKEVSTLTHGGFITPEKFEELLESGLDWITFSVDGTGETYEKIRNPLKFDETVEKIRKYHEIKKKHKSVKPIIKVQGVWPAIESSDAKKYVDTFSPIADQVSAGELRDCLRNDTEIEYIEDFGPCPVLYQRLTVGSDGKVKLCYNDEMGEVDVGDANKETIFQVWHGKKLNAARDIHLKKMGVKQLAPCKWCMYPRKTINKKTKVNNKTLTLKNYSNRPQEVGK